MRVVIVILAAALGASCGGGSSGSAGDSPASSAAAPSSMPSTSAPAIPPATSMPAAAGSQPASSSSSGSPAAPLYEVVEIPGLASGGSITANALNDQGTVVGEQETASGTWAWMYQESSGAVNQLSLDPAVAGAVANGISNSGVISGAELPGGQPPLPGFWTVSGGAMVLTFEVYSAEAVAANDSGTIIGYEGGPGTVTSEPLVWTPPAYGETVLPGLRCDHCDRVDNTASAINDAGLIVGASQYNIEDGSGGSMDSGMHAVAWQNGTAMDLGGLQGSSTSAAYSVNNSGDIVGGSRVGQAAGASTHAFLYHAGAMIDLGTLAGDSNSSANAINDSGQIVGQSESDTTTRAFLYQSGHMYDLDSLLDPASALAGLVSLQAAVGIDSSGRIAANGTDSRDPGITHAFLLIPAQ